MRAHNLDPAAANKIHDDDVARRFGFAGALVPGVELFAYLTRPFADAWGLDWLAGGRLSARFRRPVYDGEEVVAAGEPDGDGQYTATLTGTDGETRTVGVAEEPGRQEAPDPTRYSADAPTRLSSLDEVGVGPLGAVREPVTTEGHERYLAQIGETLPLYADERIVHPGVLLRAVNQLLMRNVELGPWVHTSSDVRMLATAQVPCELAVRGEVTETYQRSGHDYVRYDAVVLADGVPVMAVDHSAIYRLAGE